LWAWWLWISQGWAFDAWWGWGWGWGWAWEFFIEEI
jgi:hypothetical protein